MWEILLAGIVTDASLPYFRQFLAREALRYARPAASPRSATVMVPKSIRRSRFGGFLHARLEIVAQRREMNESAEGRRKPSLALLFPQLFSQILERREGKLVVGPRDCRSLISARTTEPSLCANSTTMFARAWTTDSRDSEAGA